MTTERIRILDVPVDSLDEAGAMARAREMLMHPGPKTVLAVNPEKIIRAQTDAGLKSHLESAGLLLPDGIGVVWAARILGLGRFRRVAGADFMPMLCALAEETGAPVFLYGAKSWVVEKAAAFLYREYPKLKIAGTQDGYLPEAKMPELINRINESGAQILFVALGSPRQEDWMRANLSKTDIRICQGVGGTFDVLAGNVKRAPEMFRRFNLEWLYRLLAEPSRIRRQTALPKFAALVIAERLKRGAA